MVAVPRAVLERVVDDRLKTIPHLTVYLRTVGRVLGQPDTVPPPVVTPGVDLRVRPYVTQHPGTGLPGKDDRRLGDTDVDLGWTTQLTCVVGDETALPRLVDAVTARFDQWRPQLPADLAHVSLGRMRLLNDPSHGRSDDSESPTRYWVPLVYALTVGN